MKLTTNTPNRLLLLLLATPHPLTAEPSSPPPLTVTLPYALYTGVRTPLTTHTNLTLTTWKGIRYASPPVGPLRWQRPQPPPQPAAAAAPAPVLAATAGPACPQAMPAIPGLGFVRGEEDCLFLNVWAAASSPSGNSTGLAPVLVVIHGGGYGLGGAGTDMTSFLQGGGEAMVVVEVQYRVHPPPPPFYYVGGWLTPAARRLRLPRLPRRQAPRGPQRRTPGPETRAGMGASARR